MAKLVEMSFGMWSHGPKESCIKAGCRVAPPAEYDWTVHVRRRGGIMSKYFDHLLLLHFASVADDAKCILATGVCVCLPVPCRIPTLLHGPGCNLWNDMACSLVVHYWADWQSAHGFRCYDNIPRTRNVSECLYSLYAWFLLLLLCYYFY